MRRQRVGLLITSILVAVLAGGSTTFVPPTPGVIAVSAPSNAPAPTLNATNGPLYGGIVTLTGTQDPPTFDSHMATSSPHNVHNAKLNANLLWNPDGDVIAPDAAESWEVSADGTIWTFRLRQNVLFHAGYTPAGPRDGTPMRAQDVKYSLEKMMGLFGVVSPRFSWMNEFVDISRSDHGLEVVDDYTLRIHLVHPFAGLPNTLAVGFSSIYPEGTTREMLAVRPYGAGPFRLESFEPGNLWEYVRNSDYFKPGLPYVDGIQVFTIVDTATVQAAFLTNRVHLIRGFPLAANKPSFDNLVAQGSIVMRPYSSQCRPQGVFMNAYRSPFNDLRLRQAVNLAIDRQAYIQAVHSGYATPALYLDTGGFGRSEAEIWQMPGYRLPKDADLAQAQQLMAEAGYPNGFNLDMKVRSGTWYQRQAEFIALELQKIGINVTLNIMDTSAFLTLFDAGDYEVISYYFCQTTGAPEELIGGYFVTGGPRNVAIYSNAQVDAGYLDMAATMDPTQRKQKAQAVEDLILADLPIAPLPVHDSSKNYWSRLQDVPMGMTMYTDEKLEQIWWSDVAPPTPTPTPTPTPMPVPGLPKLGLTVMAGLLLSAFLWAYRRRKHQPRESAR